MKATFCYVYKFWLSKFVDSKDDFLVRIIDYFFASKCSYCTNYRAMCWSFGAGLVFVGSWVSWLGVLLMLLPLLLTFLEHVWKCDITKD